jgi:NADPH:quinone reductase-like Zn-dependent oxidoreductase
MGNPGDDADQTAYNLNLTLHNVMMLTPMWKGLHERLRQQADIVRQALSLADEGKLVVRHAATFPLAEAAKAHAYLEQGQAIGKVTLEIG